MSRGRRCPMLSGMSSHALSIDESPVTVFLAITHAGMRTALWSLLEDEPGIELLAATANAGDLLRLVRRVAPAVAIVDESVFGERGTARLPELAAAAPQTVFIVVGMYDQPAYVARAREFGAVDYICLDEAERLGRSVRLSQLGAA
jgi:DNA-binding NarL/FixJ family response regulator